MIGFCWQCAQLAATYKLEEQYEDGPSHQRICIKANILGLAMTYWRLAE